MQWRIHHLIDTAARNLTWNVTFKEAIFENL